MHCKGTHPSNSSSNFYSYSYSYSFSLQRSSISDTLMSVVCSFHHIAITFSLLVCVLLGKHIRPLHLHYLQEFNQLYETLPMSSRYTTPPGNSTTCHYKTLQKPMYNCMMYNIGQCTTAARAVHGLMMTANAISSLQYTTHQ